jgi:hypothetical protein
VKAHIGIEGNEAEDKVAKEAAQDAEDQNIVFDRILITTVAHKINSNGLKHWQQQWNSTEKGATCRSFFPRLEQRLKTNISISACNEWQQTPEHIIYECNILEVQRSSLIKHVTATGGVWPPANHELITNNLNALSRLVSQLTFKN